MAIAAACTWPIETAVGESHCSGLQNGFLVISEIAPIELFDRASKVIGIAIVALPAEPIVGQVA